MSQPNPVTDPLALAWLDWGNMQGVPANTLARRAATLKTLGNPGTATREQVEAWWVSRSDRAPATRANDLANLRSFYRWCQRWEHRADDPTVRLDAPRVTKGLPRPLSRPDLLRLLDTLSDDLRRAVALGAYAGLRVSEAATLTWADIDTETNVIRVDDSKGGKSRLVRVAPLLIDQLLPMADGSVVAGGGDCPSAAQLQRRANRAIKAAGVNATFHQLRHRYGTVAYQATGDLLAVGQQMGHSSPVTTAVYAQASSDVAAKIAAAVVR